MLLLIVFTVVFYLTSFVCSFSDRLTQIQAAQTEVRNFLDKCRFLPESSHSSQFSNGEPSSDLVNAITTALNYNNNCKHTAYFIFNLINVFYS